MEWLKKLLEAQGLNEAQIKAILEGVTANYTGFVPPHRFEEVNTAKKQLEEDIKERDKQLTELKKNAGDSAALQEQITKLQADNKAASEKYEADMKDLRLSTAIKLAVTGEAHDPDLLAGLLDKTKLILADDGKLSGLDEQVKALRESKAFLFVDKKDPKFKGTKPADGKEPDGDGTKNPWAKATFNLTEQGRLLKENPDLAKQFQAAAK